MALYSGTPGQPDRLLGRVRKGPPVSCTLTTVTRASICASLLAHLLIVACSQAPPLSHTHPSPSSLASALLDALARGDRVALEALALTESEFRDHVWPELPAARPERNLPFSYVWGELHQKSDQFLSGVLASEGGRRYELIDVRFAGETDYRTYRVHRKALLRVRAPDGAEQDLRVCGSMIEQDGAWKVISYVVDD